MTNKDTAVTFLKLITSGKIQEAFDTYATSNFFHHNPYFAGDRESLITAMEENHTHFPNKVYQVKHALEDGDSVAVHGMVQLIENKQIAVVHIMRFENDKIAELWDIGQELPKDSPNKNGMF